MYFSLLLCVLSSFQASQEAKLLGSTADSNDWFGHRVAIDGDVAVVGAPGDQGEEAVFVYRDNGAFWFQQTRLTHPQGFSSRDFGEDVAVSGNVIVVGAPRDTGIVANTGAAHVYRYNGTAWVYEAKLQASDGGNNDGFARSLATGGDVIVCSAQGHLTSSVLRGAFYIFRYDPGTSSWAQEAAIIGPPFNPAGLSFFGAPVDVSGDVAVVGSIFRDSSSATGRVHVYRNSGSSWLEEDVLFGEGAVPGSNFGEGLAIQGNRLVVGEPEALGSSGVLDSGVAHVFEYSGGWSEQAILSTPGLTPTARFGDMVDIDESFVLIGCHRGQGCITGAFSGAVFLFAAESGSWSLLEPVCSADVSANDLYGRDVALHGGRALIGSLDENLVGAAYVFQLDHDTDGDSLLDGWETLGIPVAGGGPRYALSGADPEHKDLFVEIDAMDDPGLAPSQAVLDRIVAAFARAPVSNPDADDGVTLHLVLDETIPTASFTSLPASWSDFDTTKAARFGSPPERGLPNAASLLAAKKKAFRYGIFGHSLGTTRISGIAEIAGNDFVVSLGRWNTAGGTNDEKAGTFMHEFGHTLGLRHGGVDDVNFKPNYYSVMSYTWQTPRPWNTPGSWPLDYSRLALSSLNENVLDEFAGLGAPFPLPPFFISVPFNAAPLPTDPPLVRYAPMGFLWPVDWSGDGTIAGTIARDANRTSASLPASPGETLAGTEDWSHIVYGFRSSPDSLDGVHLDTTAFDEIDSDLSAELDAFPPPLADYYGAGVQNSDGCVPTLTASGVPSATLAAPFLLTANDVTPRSRGFLVYSFAPGEYPLPRGTLLVQRPLSRSPALDSGGSGACGGSYSFDMNAVIQALPDPTSWIGLQVFAQYVYEDRVGTAQRFGLTNAVRFTVQP